MQLVRFIDTSFVHHEIRDMKKNITISTDRETARWVRVEAAKRDMSVSRFIGDLLRKQREQEDEYEAAMRAYLTRERRALRKDPTEAYPSREELYDRGRLR